MGSPLKLKSAFIYLTFVLSTLLACAIGTAQQAPAQDSAMARSLFVQGAKAAKAGEWARAKDAFAASYALHKSPRTLFNLGIARAELGELVAASEALRAFLRDADAAREADNIAIARRELARMEPLIAFVRIEADDVHDGDQLDVDGRLLPSGVLGTDLPLDPGAHRIRLVAPEQVTAERELKLMPGERATIELVVEKSPSAVAAPLPKAALTEPTESAPPLATKQLPARRDDEHSGSKTRRRWLIGAGVAVAVTGAALTTFLLMRNEQEDTTVEPVESNVIGGVLRVP